MTAFTFRPAVRENVGLLIGLAGGTGSGKSKSAFRLASGISPDKPFAVIDTESRRALHYASDHKFDHGELRPPFTPSAYADAIKAADDAKYPVIVVDSASHEHAGEGGLLDWAEEELQRMAGDDWKKREACLQASWIKPKRAHIKMMNTLLQIRAHLILCFRAQEKTELVKTDGKWKMEPKRSRVGKDGWIPICEKGLPFELTCSFLLIADRPGIPHPIKCEEQHRHLFPADRPIDENSGRALAAWAAGGAAPEAIKRDTPALADSLPRNALLEEAEAAAGHGTEILKKFWARLNHDGAALIEAHKDRLKATAAEADKLETSHL